MTIADEYLNAGADAYNRHDFKTSLELYRKAAELGSVTAMSNLGYTYLYARGVEKDEQKAREYFELAMKRGDPNATYKIGDFYLYGQAGLEKNEDEAVKLYHRAFRLSFFSEEEVDTYAFPDVCLRLARYYKDRNTDLAEKLIDDALNLIKQRIENGDTFSDSVLKRAEELKDEIEGFRKKQTDKALVQILMNELAGHEERNDPLWDRFVGDGGEKA